MNGIIIDEQFKFLLPELDEETYRLLEESILEHGCRDPLVLWKSDEKDGVLIDGYNRYKICTEHSIPFKTVEMEFSSREEVVIWIIQTQVSRRNLTPFQLSYFRGLHYKADKKNQSNNSPFASQGSKSQNGTLTPGSTATRLSEQYNVSRNTILRDSKLAEALNRVGEASPEAKKKILSGEVSINKSKLDALASAEEEVIEAVANQIEEGTYTRRASRDPSPIASDSLLPEMKQLNTIISSFARDFNSMFQKMNTGNNDEVKPILRSFIDQLEDLYKTMN